MGEDDTPLSSRMLGHFERRSQRRLWEAWQRARYGPARRCGAVAEGSNGRQAGRIASAELYAEPEQRIDRRRAEASVAAASMAAALAAAISAAFTVASRVAVSKAAASTVPMPVAIDTM